MNRFLGYSGFLFFVAAMLSISPAQAQVFSRMQELSFGTFALRNNTGVHQLRITQAGVITANSNYARFTDPVRGRYRMQGYPPSTVFTITIPNTTLSLNGLGAGELFNLDLLHPATRTANGAGNATFFVGGSLTTSGSGTMYSDGNYQGDMDVTINY